MVLEDHEPSSIILGGDSAGATLTLAVIAHVRHPNRAIQPLRVEQSFKALLLASPWGEYNTDTKSWRDNRYKDYRDPITFMAWSKAYISDSPLNNYNAPCLAPAHWWQGMLAPDILIVAGGEECLVDSAAFLAKKIKFQVINAELFKNADKLTGIQSSDQTCHR